MANDVSTVGARLREAEQRRGQTAREKKLRSLVGAAIGPEALAVARLYLPEEPGKARELEAVIQRLAEKAVIAALGDGDLLKRIGPGRALLLDGRGGAEVIADPTGGGT